MRVAIDDQTGNVVRNRYTTGQCCAPLLTVGVQQVASALVDVDV
jgi:hypothetical protein